VTLSTSMQCSDCGEPLESHVYGCIENLPCPRCGSFKKAIDLSIVEAVAIKESLRGKVKDSTKTGKSKLRQELLVGDDLHRNSGEWYKKERYINKDNDTYKEVVTNPKTGEIVHHCEEPLSQHKGHGSAKPKGEEG
jgi:hypothetical protein